MKKILVVSIGSLIWQVPGAHNNFSTVIQTTQAAQSQQKYDPHEQTNKLAKSLALSEDQKAKVLVILTDISQKKETLGAKLGANAKSSSDWKVLQEDKENRVKEVLTDSQYEKYLKLREEIKQRDQYFWDFETGPLQSE